MAVSFFLKTILKQNIPDNLSYTFFSFVFPFKLLGAQSFRYLVS